MSETIEIVVDARGHRCPVPTLRLSRALREAPPGAHLRLLADDPLARIDIPHLLGQIDARLVAVEQREAQTTFMIIKAS